MADKTPGGSQKASGKVRPFGGREGGDRVSRVAIPRKAGGPNGIYLSAKDLWGDGLEPRAASGRWCAGRRESKLADRLHGLFLPPPFPKIQPIVELVGLNGKIGGIA